MLYKSTFLQLIVLSLIGLLQNNAFGQFTTKQLTTDISDFMIDLDLNNDGQSDIIAIGYDSIDGQLDHLFYFENNSGTFLNPVSIGRLPHERNIELRKADINNDGFEDLVYFRKTTGEVNMYQNLANGSLSAPIQLVGQFPQTDGIQLADMDNDNLVDIVASSLSTDQIVWFKNGGLSGFDPAETIVALSPGSYTIRFTITDYNSDGNRDVFYISQVTKQLMLADGLGNGTFDAPVVLDLYTSLNNNLFLPIINCFDINQDGTEDLVVNMLDNTDNVLWYEITAGTISPRHVLLPTISSVLYEPLFTDWVDLNGDGFKELVIADWNDVIYFPNNAGTMSATPVQLISNLPSYILNISIRDFNGDNYPDILVNDANTGIKSYVNNTTFGFSLLQTLSPDLINPVYTTPVDLDADGLIDIAFVKANSNKLNWMKNLGNNNFGEPQEFFTVPFAPFFLSQDVKKFQLADLDNDGINDLITLKGTGSTGYLECFKGLGNLTYGASMELSLTTLEIFDFTLADLDNDTDQDIVYCAYYDDQVGFYKNQGSGSFSTAQVIDNTCDQPSAVIAADMDNDSNLDLISISVGDDKLKTYPNTGNGVFAPPVVVASQPFANTYQLFAEDADGDSLRDIIMAEPNTDKVSWFKNLGGLFSAQHMITTAFNTPRIQPVDYDNDGDPDILCSSNYYALDTRGTYLLENPGNGNYLSTGPKLLTVIASGYTRGDFDGDGDQDIVSCSENRLFYSENDHNGKTTAKGTIFLDLNSNGVLDTAEMGITSIGIVTNPEANYIFSDQLGNYRVNLYDTTQLHTISTQPFPNWGLTTPANYTLSVNAQFTEVDSLNFGFYPTVVVDSISTTLVGGFPRCNDTINYWLNVRNYGSSLPSGTISLSLDTNLTYVTANPIPDSISNGNLYWNYENLFYFKDTLINIHVVTPGFMQMGEELVSSSAVTIVDSLENIVYTSNDTLSQTLVCAYDPNDKTAEPSGVGYPGYVNDLNDIEYLIRFQNTGNDTALTIIVKDQLDPNLDWSSIQPVCASHEFSTSVNETGLLTFTFANIHLPDSNANELASHGFVVFRIKANDNLPVGTVIQNHAEIYFDMNPAVLTNYKLLTLFDCKSLFNGAPQPDAVFCVGDSVQFGVNFPATDYEWQSTVPSSAGSGTAVMIAAQTIGLNTYTVHAENAVCSLDSVVHFTVPSIPVISEGQLQVCQGDSILIYNEFRNAAGIYSDTLQSQYGCDSIVTKELIVHTIQVVSEGQLQVCQGDSVLIYNEYQNTAGLYYDTLQNQFGCDSIVVKELVVSVNPDVDFGYNSNDTLCLSNGTIIFDNSSPSGGTYSGNGIAGNTFDPDLAGTGTHILYYHFVGPDLCGSTDSLVLTIEDCLGIKDVTTGIMTVYPNPTDGKVFIDFMQPFSGEVIIRDVAGKVCYAETYSENQNIEVNIAGQAGIYFLEASGKGNLRSVYKLLKY
jgi:hypothetical protein